jgi:hypothetical protein
MSSLEVVESIRMGGRGDDFDSPTIYRPTNQIIDDSSSDKIDSEDDSGVNGQSTQDDVDEIDVSVNYNPTNQIVEDAASESADENGDSGDDSDSDSVDDSEVGVEHSGEADSSAQDFGAVFSIEEDRGGKMRVIYRGEITRIYVYFQNRVWPLRDRYQIKDILNDEIYGDIKLNSGEVNIDDRWEDLSITNSYSVNLGELENWRYIVGDNNLYGFYYQGSDGGGEFGGAGASGEY